MRLFEPGLVHVRMGVLGPVVVGMGMHVLDVLVVMTVMRVRVLDVAVLVLVRVRAFVGVLLSHLRPSFWCEKCCLSSLIDDPQPVIAAMMARDSGAGVLGVVDGVDDKLANVVVLQAVEDRRALPAGLHQSCHS